MSIDTQGSSPHTRGAPFPFEPSALFSGIIPAYAGSTLAIVSPLSICRDHPRIRGEHPRSTISSPLTSGSSPHTRGAHEPVFFAQAPSGIIPAYAGSTETATRVSMASWDHPRIRGEHSTNRAISSPIWGSSPHTRGAPYSAEHDGCKRGIIPAYAGSTSQASVLAHIRGDHPRIRGEHSFAKSVSLRRTGSSPHTRGAPAMVSRWSGLGGIIPAYAGSTTRVRRIWTRLRDHPRIRGEHLMARVWKIFGMGSSPHTRGARIHPADFQQRQGIIPAYAGSTRSNCRPRLSSRDHPRIRGEHVEVTSETFVIWGSSPHTRGAPRDWARALHGTGIIPAYAGSTAYCFLAVMLRRDHPRIRGEHTGIKVEDFSRWGSSPHTRGAPETNDNTAVAMGIIPAYAGSTPALHQSGARTQGSSPHTRGAR